MTLSIGGGGFSSASADNRGVCYTTVDFGTNEAVFNIGSGYTMAENITGTAGLTKIGPGFLRFSYFGGDRTFSISGDVTILQGVIIFGRHRPRFPNVTSFVLNGGGISIGDIELAAT